MPPIPYWPAPSGAPGACSCNTGDIYLSVAAAETQTFACLRNAIGRLDAIYQCDCCFQSVAISTCVPPLSADETPSLTRASLLDVCPATDPTDIGLQQALQFGPKAGMPWASCGAYLQGADCVGALSFSAPGPLYGPGSTPAPGTQTLFDEAGEATAPASGATFTWTARGGGTVSGDGGVGGGGGRDGDGGFLGGRGEGDGSGNGGCGEGWGGGGEAWVGRIGRGRGDWAVDVAVMWML